MRRTKFVCSFRNLFACLSLLCVSSAAWSHATIKRSRLMSAHVHPGNSLILTDSRAGLSLSAWALDSALPPPRRSSRKASVFTQPGLTPPAAAVIQSEHKSRLRRILTFEWLPF